MELGESRVWFLIKLITGTEEIAQWLRALTALLEVLSSIPRNHMVNLMVSSYRVFTYICIHIYIFIYIK